MMNVNVNDVLFCNWGAMHPTEERVVAEVNEDFVVCTDGQVFNRNNIKAMGERSVNGSPIGVFVKPAYNPNPEFAGDWDDYYNC